MNDVFEKEVANVLRAVEAFLCGNISKSDLALTVGRLHLAHELAKPTAEKPSEDPSETQKAYTKYFTAP